MNIGKVLKKIEEKEGQALLKMSVVLFSISFFLGFLGGVFFRELRLNLLEKRQSAQRLYEEQVLGGLSEKYSQSKLLPKK